MIGASYTTAVSITNSWQFSEASLFLSITMALALKITVCNIKFIINIFLFLVLFYLLNINSNLC